MTERERAFTEIYGGGGWGGKGSGGGSDPIGARPYVNFVLDYVRHHGVTSVCDVGCGDWQMWPQGAFSNQIDYLGLDIVDSVVEGNIRRFGTPTRRFARWDAVAVDPPAADLLLCKEVLQHLPNEDVRQFLATNLGRYKHVVLCADIRMESSVVWRRLTRRAIGGLGSPVPPANSDIHAGGYRPVRFDKLPFVHFGLEVAAVYVHVTGGTCRTEKAIWVRSSDSSHHRPAS